MGEEREVMEAAMEAGHILPENGAGIFRVEETINRICKHYGIISSNAFVLRNGIFVTSGNMLEKYVAKVPRRYYPYFGFIAGAGDYRSVPDSAETVCD